jgi:hypothetical protein
LSWKEGARVAPALGPASSEVRQAETRYLPAAAAATNVAPLAAAVEEAQPGNAAPVDAARLIT